MAKRKAARSPSSEGGPVDATRKRIAEARNSTPDGDDADLYDADLFPAMSPDVIDLVESPSEDGESVADTPGDVVAHIPSNANYQKGAGTTAYVHQVLTSGPRSTGNISVPLL